VGVGNGGGGVGVEGSGRVPGPDNEVLITGCEHALEISRGGGIGHVKPKSTCGINLGKTQHLEEQEEQEGDSNKRAKGQKGCHLFLRGKNEKKSTEKNEEKKWQEVEQQQQEEEEEEWKGNNL